MNENGGKEKPNGCSGMFLSGHCCDEGGPLPTAFLRGQEGDGTLGGQVFDGLFQNSGETRIIIKKKDNIVCCLLCGLQN